MDTPSLLETLKKPEKNNFFILDIDSTLVTTHQRNQAILEDWIKAKSKQFADDCSDLQSAKCQFGDYGLVHALKRVDFKEKNPGSKKDLETFWKTHFFSNKYLHSDVPVRGAVDWIQTLEELGVEFVYLTARHKSTMWDGTLSSLDAMGFPIDESLLFLKENLDHSDEEYKTLLMGELIKDKKDYDLWLIDNEPVVLNRVAQDHPEVKLIWFDSTHSGRMQPPETAFKINSFTF